MTSIRAAPDGSSVATRDVPGGFGRTSQNHPPYQPPGRLLGGDPVAHLTRRGRARRACASPRWHGRRRRRADAASSSPPRGSTAFTRSRAAIVSGSPSPTGSSTASRSSTSRASPSLASSASRNVADSREQLEHRACGGIGEQLGVEPVGHHLGFVDRPAQQVELAPVDRATRRDRAAGPRTSGARRYAARRSGRADDRAAPTAALTTASRSASASMPSRGRELHDVLVAHELARVLGDDRRGGLAGPAAPFERVEVGRGRAARSRRNWRNGVAVSTACSSAGGSSGQTSAGSLPGGQVGDPQLDLVLGLPPVPLLGRALAGGVGVVREHDLAREVLEARKWSSASAVPHVATALGAPASANAITSV